MTDKDKLKELTELGEKMRNAQKEYFKTRSQHYLGLSKDLERQFDEKIKAIISEEKYVQASLF